MKTFFLSTFLLLAMILVFSAAISPVIAAQDYGLNETSKTAFDNTDIKDASEHTSIPQIIGRVINVVLSLLGIIFLILTIYGGLLWMTAGGNDDKVGRAIKIFTNAAYGLLIVIAAFLITRYIGNAFINSLQ